MSAELQYFNRSSTGLATYYVLMFQGSNVANGGGLTNIEFAWTNTIVRNNVIQLVDTSHVGIYLADMTEGIPAGRYTPVIFQAVGDPATTATTTDALIARLDPIDWTGEIVSGMADIATATVAALNLSVDDSGRVDIGKINGNANAAAVFGALGAMGFTGNSSEPPAGKDFAFNDDLNNPAPTPSAGWLIFYLGEPRRILTYNVITLSGTTDRPFTTAMEGGNALIVLPSYGTSPTTAENATATVAALAGSIEVNVLNPTDTEGETTIVAGDAYSNGALLDRRLTYTVTGFTGNISGATVRWKAVRRSHYDRDDSAAAELTVTTGTVTLSAGVLTFKVPLTATQTAAMQNTVINTSTANYKIQVSLLSGGEVLTHVLADGFVLKAIG